MQKEANKMKHSKLTELLNNIDYRLIAGDMNKEAEKICWDSRKADSGSLFIAVIGGGTDGHKYIESALKLGAVIVVCDKVQNVITDDELKALSDTYNATIVEIEDTRTGMARIAANMYDHPEKKLSLFGITGTKGKTTSAFMLHKILLLTGHKAGLMGTVCQMMGDKVTGSDHTTPEAPVTYEFLYQLAEGGYDSCVMEVSSLGLKLERNYGMTYKAGCFTNLYSDHIGGIEHPDMEDYFGSKLKIFDMCETSVINMDSARINDIIECDSKKGHRSIRYGIDNGVDLKAENMRKDTLNGVNGTSFELVTAEKTITVFVPIPGRFNVYNALCALGAAYAYGIDLEDAAKALVDVHVPGRLQPVKNKLGINILVDYAHNGEALSNVIETAKEFTEGQVITLFGCGGNRPPDRRTEMGKVAGEMSDYTIITSDNPRNEEPLAIIDDILASFTKTNGKYEVEPDRKTAIEKAIKIAKPGDTVLIAGKGHEDYQEIKGVKYPFDDFKTASEFVKTMEEGL